MEWTKNQDLKALVRKLENAACDCNMMLGHHCEFHTIANNLRNEIEKEVNANQPRTNICHDIEKYYQDEPNVIRLESLISAIEKHKEEKTLTPSCTCWVNDTEELDKILYESLNYNGLDKITYLEKAIRTNLDGKKPIRDCRCFGNAPQIIDTELEKVLNDL